MDYIKLGRILDSKCDSGYMPDDILNVLLSYTGTLRHKPTYLYKVYVRFTYTKYVFNYLYDNNGIVNRAIVDEEKSKKLQKGSQNILYCSCCDKCYKSKTHLKSKYHKKNAEKYGDRNKELKPIMRKYIEEIYKRNTKVGIIEPTFIKIRDVWRY